MTLGFKVTWLLHCFHLVTSRELQICEGCDQTTRREKGSSKIVREEVPFVFVLQKEQNHVYTSSGSANESPSDQFDMIDV